jgi:hypothetical protein
MARLDGMSAADRRGSWVAAGDINGDGFAHLIVGASYADPGGKSYARSSYVVFGKGARFSAGIDLSSLDGTTGIRLGGVAASEVSERGVGAELPRRTRSFPYWRNLYGVSAF